MKKITYVFFVLLFCSIALANEGDVAAVKSCLRKFQNHPFDANNPTFDTLTTAVKVLGIGAETSDLESTPEPKLILIKPNVTVLSKSQLNLQNPNGWYCLKGHVAVLGKSIVNLHCSATIATSGDEVNVLGKSESGVTVLGSSRVVRNNCK